METARNFEKPALEDPGKERRERIHEESERIGKLLAHIWETLRQKVPPQEREEFSKRAHFIFRKGSPEGKHVQLTAVDFKQKIRPQSRIEDVPLKVFKIQLFPPEENPQTVYAWDVDESARGEDEGWSVVYEPRTFEFDHWREAAKRVDPEEFHVGMVPDPRLRDPDVQHVQEAARIMEESWRQFESGSNKAITYWSLGGRRSYHE